MLESRMRKKPLTETKKNEDEDKSQNQPENGKLVENPLKANPTCYPIQSKKLVFDKMIEQQQKNSESEDDDFIAPLVAD